MAGELYEIVAAPRVTFHVTRRRPQQPQSLPCRGGHPDGDQRVARRELRAIREYVGSIRRLVECSRARSELDAVVVFDGKLLGVAALKVAGEFSAAIEALVVAVVGFFGLGVGEVDPVLGRAA